MFLSVQVVSNDSSICRYYTFAGLLPSAFVKSVHIDSYMLFTSCNLRFMNKIWSLEFAVAMLDMSNFLSNT